MFKSSAHFLGCTRKYDNEDNDDDDDSLELRLF